MKIYIENSELYPCYDINTINMGYDCGVDIPENKVNEILKVMVEFNKVQNYLDKLYMAEIDKEEGSK